ncbi:MAG: RidA family protein [Henriciella sp.]
MSSLRRLISTGSPFEESMAYSRAVVQGDWCFVSGVTGYDYKQMAMPESVTEQARNCFKTILSILDEAGFSDEHIARVQYTITDRTFAEHIAPVLEAFLGDVRPAATMITAGLIDPQMKVEIEVTAFKG